MDTFVPADAIDPMYLSGTGYYLVPEGPVGQRPYALIRDALADENRVAIGRAVVSSRERLVMVRPVGDLLSMSVLQYASEVRRPSVVSDELVEMNPSEEELELTRRLVQGLTREDLELAEYRDEYTEKMREIIDAKVAGQEVVSPPAPAEEAPGRKPDGRVEGQRAADREAREEVGGQCAEPGQGGSAEAQIGVTRMHEIVLPAEVWSPLVSYTPPYILDRDGIVQHEPLAKLLREKGFDTERELHCKFR